MGVFMRDERAWFRAAGVGRFARGKGGHLHDEPCDLRSATIQMMESSLLESMATEHGMVLQNLALMTEALGLGGFPNFARHEYSWFKAAGFRMQFMQASRYAGAPRLLTALARWIGKDPALEYPVGLERDNQILLKPFCPPYYKWRMQSTPSCYRSSGKTEPTELERNRALGAAWFLVLPRYRRPAQRRCKRQSHIAIIFFAATEGFPHIPLRFGPSLGSRFVAWTSISMTAFIKRRPFRIRCGSARNEPF